MLKKILGVLLIPAMIIGVFAGCGKDHTLSDVNKLYNHMVDKYSYDIEGDAGNKASNFFLSSFRRYFTECEEFILKSSS